jgi:hypothetical protein
MKMMILAAAILAHGTARAAVENILSLQRESTGSFSVVCENDGSVSQFSGIDAVAVRGDQVCAGESATGPLEAGQYSTASDFCGQIVRWKGDKLELLLESPCQGTLTLETFKDGWYRGKLAGYSYIYEVQVTDARAYTFYSRDFGTQGDFVFGPRAPSAAIQGKTSLDPASH